MMDMQDQEEERRKVGMLLESGVDNLLGTEEFMEAFKAACFPVEAQPEVSRSSFANWFLQNKAEGTHFGFVNWKVFHGELERRMARKGQANQGR